MLSSKHSLSRSGCRHNVSRCAPTLCAFLLRALILHLERFRPPPAPLLWLCRAEVASVLTRRSRSVNRDSIYVVCYFVAEQHSLSGTTK